MDFDFDDMLSESELEDEFIIHRPSFRQPNKHHQQRVLTIFQITKKCQEIYQRIMKEEVSNFTRSLFAIITQNLQHYRSYPDEKWKVIIPVMLKKNQVEDLQMFMDAMSKRIEKQCNNSDDDEEDEEENQDQKDQAILKGRGKGKGKGRGKSKGKLKQKGKEKGIDNKQTIKQQKQMPNQKQKEQTIKNKRHLLSKMFDKINIVKNDYDEIRTIALSIHKKYQSYHITEKHSMIYIGTGVSNVSPKNTYIFEEGLIDTKCTLILPTFNNFQQFNYYSGSKIQVIPQILFKAKNLFCKFFYQVICDKQIMAYLPPQSTQLISDFDIYPISFRQGVRRLIFCIQQMYYLMQQKKIRQQYVNVNEPLHLIRRSLRKIFHIFYSQDNVIDKQIKAILEKQTYYTPFDRFLTKTFFFQHTDGGNLDQELLIGKFQDKIKKQFESSENLKEFVDVLQNGIPSTNNRKRGVDEDCKRYGINNKRDMKANKKIFIEQNLSYIVKKLTFKIREFSKHISWDEIGFTEHIRPMIPFKIHQSVMKSKKHAALLNIIESKASTPLYYIIKQFCKSENQKDNISFGELIYYMKDLELYGLVDIIYRSLAPIVSPAYFPKAKFADKRN